MACDHLWHVTCGHLTWERRGKDSFQAREFRMTGWVFVRCRRCRQTKKVTLGVGFFNRGAAAPYRFEPSEKLGTCRHQEKQPSLVVFVPTKGGKPLRLFLCQNCLGLRGREEMARRNARARGFTG